MKKAKEKIILMLLKHILKRASSDKIPRSGNEGERVNCYTAIAYKDHEGLIIRYYSEGYLVCLKHDGRKYSIQTKITFSELMDYEVKIIHYYGLNTITYFSWLELARGMAFRLPYITSWLLTKKEWFLQGLFNRKKLVTKDRIEILRAILNANLDGEIKITPLSIMSIIHSDRWYLHPNRELELSKIELYLEALSDTNELKRTNHMQYDITGHGISAIEIYEEQERKHTDNISNQRRIFWLTIVIALLTFVQAGLIKMPSIIDLTNL